MSGGNNFSDFPENQTTFHAFGQIRTNNFHQLTGLKNFRLARSSYPICDGGTEDPEGWGLGRSAVAPPSMSQWGIWGSATRKSKFFKNLRRNRVFFFMFRSKFRVFFLHGNIC